MLDKTKSKVVAGVVGVSTALLPVIAFADEGGVAGDVSDALQTTAASITGVLGSVAPVALGIVGVFLAWKYGMRFFKSLSK